MKAIPARLPDSTDARGLRGRTGHPPDEEAMRFWRSFGYIPAGEYVGDNTVETSQDRYVVPLVLKEFRE